ncbi:hypothetical protein EW146_g8071 [Bondarzewia mesenterica]|uniref:Uncharacterized protein n=1 Tax=Bondarzewia mesenterica TaxID=1095465 RepID=A0A4S4LH83_9AGAM|nr:hypothetical protein EW146_g8071 [Bondarzewia mesenterica]
MYARPVAIPDPVLPVQSLSYALAAAAQRRAKFHAVLQGTAAQQKKYCVIAHAAHFARVGDINVPVCAVRLLPLLARRRARDVDEERRM